MRKILIVLSVLYGCFCGVVHACDTNEIDVLGNGSNCQTAKFTITTTNLSANTKFKFYMSAMGTFYVDWGDGTVDTIVRTDTDETLYNHTFTTAGTKTIRFGGLATGYSNRSSISTSIDAAIRFGYYGDIGGYQPSNKSTPELISAIDGCLGAIFPRLDSGSVKLPAFAFTFAKTNIKTIPENLFYGARGSKSYMFVATFGNCTSLKTIPENLFSEITGYSPDIFRYTFSACISLTSLPQNLFAGIRGSAHYIFLGTFSECYSLTGYIPPSMFNGLIQNGSPYDNYGNGMMYNMFVSTNLATTCPAGTVQFITGYEDYWNGHVSCIDENLVCGSGEYLPQHWYQCEKCPENNYCSGGTYTYNGSDQGATACPSGLYSPIGMWESAQCGRILHIGDEVVYLRSSKKTTPALHVDIDNDGVADFFGNVTTLDVPMHAGSERKLKLQHNGITYSVYDDTVNVGE